MPTAKKRVRLIWSGGYCKSLIPQMTLNALSLSPAESISFSALAAIEADTELILEGCLLVKSNITLRFGICDQDLEIAGVYSNKKLSHKTNLD